MSSFIGDYICKVDSKGRLVMPSNFIKQVAPEALNQFVIKKDIYEECLVLIPKDEWQRMVAVLRAKLNPYNKSHKQFLRGFYADTAELSLDANNRITIPKNILGKIAVEKELKLVAQDDKIEIWNPTTYASSFDEKTFREIAENIFNDEE